MASKTISDKQSISKQTNNNINTIINTKTFNPETINFGPVKINTEKGNKWVNTENSGKRFLMVAKNCNILKLTLKEDGKYNIYMGVNDTDFIKAVETYDKSLINYGVKNSNEWFNDDMTDQECNEMFKPKTLSYNEKYGYSISSNLSKEFLCKSKTEDVPDVSDLNVALQKYNVIDVCFWFTKIKLGVGKYSVGFEIMQINVISLGNTTQYKSNAITINNFESGKIILTERETLDKGAKKCKVLYGEGESAKTLRLKFENINARIFSNKQPGDEKVNFSLNIILKDPLLRKCIETIDEEIFKLLLDKSKEYYDVKKTSKLLRPIVKSLLSYGKADQDKIKKGEKPSYEPSLWVKIYHSDENGFADKIINVDTNKPINNVTDLVNKELNISSLEIYSKHIWFGPKGTSINFTLNNCEISFDNPVNYVDMDNIDGDDDGDGDDDDYTNNKDTNNKDTNNKDTKIVEEEVEIEEADEVINSDDESDIEEIVKTTSKIDIKKTPSVESSDDSDDSDIEEIVKPTSKLDIKKTKIVEEPSKPIKKTSQVLKQNKK